MATLRTSSHVKRAVSWHDEANKEEVDNVKDAYPPNDLFGSPRDLLPWVVCLSSGETGKLSTAESERSSHEDGAEAMEAVEECAVRIMPVPGADVATVVAWNSSSVDDDAEKYEPKAGTNLHHGQDELNLTVSPDTKELDDDEEEEQRYYPGAVINICNGGPVADDLGMVSVDLKVL